MHGRSLAAAATAVPTQDEQRQAERQPRHGEKQHWLRHGQIDTQQKHSRYEPQEGLRGKRVEAKKKKKEEDRRLEGNAKQPIEDGKEGEVWMEENGMHKGGRRADRAERKSRRQSERKERKC